MSLVLKRGAQLAAYHPYAKRARTAFTVGSRIYANRRSIAMAARTIGRSYRRYRKRRTRSRASKKRKFSVKNIGDAPGTSSSKRAVTTDQAPTNLSTRTQYVYDLFEVPQGTDIDQRERRIMKVGGVKFCAEIKNLTNAPLYVNWAILAGKAGGLSGVSNTDFFRASDGADRARNFAVDLTGSEFHCLPINTDKYHVLQHKRFTLVPSASGGDTVALTGKSYTNIDTYKKFNRQIQFDGTVGGPESGETSLVIWCSKFGEAGGAAISANAWNVSLKTICYFRDPK